MIKDVMKREVEIVGEGNNHMLTYGMTGQGKTFFLNREIEARYRKGKKILILDFSGSYLEGEMLKNQFMYLDQIKRFDLSESNMQWVLQDEVQDVLVKDIADSLCEILCCTSYYQKKILMNAVACTLERENQVGIPELFLTLEEMLVDEQEKEKVEKTVGNVENIQRLLTRLNPYAEIESFKFSQDIKVTTDYCSKPITIINLTYYPESQRKFLTELILAMLWREMYRQKHQNRCDVVLLDEMQFLSLEEGSTLSGMLREGRKKGLELLLGTQFIGHYRKSELHALQQAGNIIIFRPTPEDYRRSARIIDPENSNAWVKILSGLKRGEAVLKGTYHLKGNHKRISTPIVIHIE